jgi:hypothetical protein
MNLDFGAALDLDKIARRDTQYYRTIAIPAVERILKELNQTLKERGITIQFTNSYSASSYEHSTDVKYVCITGQVNATKSVPLVYINYYAGKIQLYLDVGWNSKQRIIMMMREDPSFLNQFFELETDLINIGWKPKQRCENWMKNGGQKYIITKEYSSLNIDSFFDNFLKDLNVVQESAVPIIDHINTYAPVAVGNTSQVNIRIVSRNTILYGPPGTGKTYTTKSVAIRIIEEPK